jgi:hypothetical protein
MNESLKAFKDGVIQGARETPRGFFARLGPVSLAKPGTDEALSGKGRQDEASRADRLCRP